MNWYIFTQFEFYFLFFSLYRTLKFLELKCNPTNKTIMAVADPGFPVGGTWTPEAVTFRKFCMSK